MHATLISDSVVWFAILTSLNPFFAARLQRCKDALAVVRCLSGCLFVTFVYCVETVKDMAIVAMECE